MRKKRYTVRRGNEGKILTFSEETCLEKERVRSKVTPRKVGVELKRSGELIAPINSRLNVVVQSRPRLGWVEMAVGLSEDPNYPGHSSRYIVVICC